MAFAEFESTGGSSRRKTNYLKIVSGVPTVVRILDKHAVVVFRHWLRDGEGRSVGVNCVGPDHCPICQRNAQLGYNKDHPDFIPSRKRYRVNVVDLTPVKRCSKCDAAYVSTTAPSVCTADGCGGDLSGVAATPLDEVKILERGQSLMRQFNALEKAPHPMSGEVLPLQAYPIMLIATGKGMDMVITVVPQMVQEITHEYELFDLTSGLELTPDETVYLMEGGNLSEILAERKAARETVASDFPSSGESKERIPF